jgi:hypothetical protein
LITEGEALTAANSTLTLHGRGELWRAVGYRAGRAALLRSASRSLP